MELTGSSALVTGGASGLGAATVRLLAERGLHVVIADLPGQREWGAQLAAETGAAFVATDVTNAEQVIEAVEAAVTHGPLRAVVCCAGVGGAARTIGRDARFESAHDVEMFRRVIEVNLVGTFNCIRLAATAMSQNEPDVDGARGAIVCTASVAAEDGQVGQAAYSASKGGIVGMTLPIARDLAVVGIRVNTILPGPFDTPIFGDDETAAPRKQNLAAATLFPKRLGLADEFASLAWQLLTNSYLNAETIRLDAGIRLPPK